MQTLSILNLIIAVLWLVSATIDTAGHTYFWQLKWYRIDRFKDFLSTKQGQSYVLSYPVFWRGLLAIALLYFLHHETLLLKYSIISFFVIDIIRLGYLYIHKQLRRPQPSIKALLILTISLAVEAIWLLFTHNWDILLLVLIVRPFLIGGVVIVINEITNLIKKIYFIRAEKKLKKYQNLKIIGITGSYGKTTVKEFLSSILGEKFCVIYTPKNINSDIGISKFILQTDFSKAHIFIVEIGAYNTGDVQLVCDIVHPSIGILTAINEQHLSLFGSMEKIQSAKYELLRAIPKNGLAITNSDNEYCREFLDEIKAKVATFGIEKKYGPTCEIEDLTDGKHQVLSVDILLQHGEKSLIHFHPKTTGRHNALNIAPCILVADFLGMSKEEIITAVNNVSDPKTAIHSYSYGKATIVDDSYNSNPQGFKAALDVLAAYPSARKRVVITRGMLELGDRSEELHEEIAGEISFVADELVIITPDFIEPLKKGIAPRFKKIVVSVKTNPEELLSYIQSLKETDVVILLENRVPSIIHQELDKYKTNSTA
ncbi:UDP-N-acetylmuramoyl-tripeptide--D-alanyl-D-alanine ligase [Patescibacteria group bacterium]|nr:UDP-N-acetylmuramoyl-tripeptide--D-alanyl-D-alanine ligase [Patescibacteria group bacterium]MBU1721968.1 UDP-N-acetylmuramoyl-tripeptide--D-alanyl-D-alanine ligase [Patescibacteria group bacterium]MBU1901284.1 UDP-N-acetylmuramoyl-tripeptide--D-alanyl-D-alanine ligase [Patescibacteria group bacterium]